MICKWRWKHLKKVTHKSSLGKKHSAISIHFLLFGINLQTMVLSSKLKCTVEENAIGNKLFFRKKQSSIYLQLYLYKSK